MGLADYVRSAESRFRPFKIIIYGKQGIGKNTFAATFPKPILIPVEEGADFTDCDILPRMANFGNLIWSLESLLSEEHNWRTVIIDSADWLEPLVWDATIEAYNNSSDRKGALYTSIEDFGYGKGFIEAENYWRKVLGLLDRLRVEKGMHCLFIAHSEQKRYEPPDSEGYDIYQMKLNKRSSALLQEWADFVFFMNYDRVIKHVGKPVSKNDPGKIIADGTGSRFVYTAERPTHYAKRRIDLPDVIVIGKDTKYKAFHEALSAATGGKYKQEG